jgi:hypothetical protein
MQLHIDTHTYRVICVCPWMRLLKRTAHPSLFQRLVEQQQQQQQQYHHQLSRLPSSTSRTKCGSPPRRTLGTKKKHVSLSNPDPFPLLHGTSKGSEWQALFCQINARALTTRSFFLLSVNLNHHFRSLSSLCISIYPYPSPCIFSLLAQQTLKVHHCQPNQRHPSSVIHG